MTVGLGGAGCGYNLVREIGIAHGPLKRLLCSHGKADDGAQVSDVQLVYEQGVDGADVIANRHQRKARPVERLRGIAWRRRTAIAE